MASLPAAAAPPGRVAGAVWTPLPPRTCLLVNGPDASRFVDNFTTAAVGRLEPGTGSEGFFTDARGWVLALASILRTDEGLWIDDASPSATRLRDHLDHYLIRERVTFFDASSERNGFLVAGPAAPAWLGARVSGPLPAAPLTHGRVRVGGIDAAIARLSWCGPNGFFVQVATPDAARLEAWFAAERLPRAAADDAAALRLEAGWPDPGDIPDKALPQEFGRDERAISFTKGCYLGQETVARIDALGHVNRRLVGLATDRAAAAGAEVRSGGQTVARVTSACTSPRLASGLALALVPRAAIDRADLEVDGRPARVVPLPLAPAAPAEELLFTAHRFCIVRIPQPRSDGSMAAREVIIHPGSVVVVPFVTTDDICLIEVVRIAVGGTLVELPAGTLDREEPLATAAARELLEETGYRAGRIEAAGSFWMSPGILRERMHLFIARDLAPGPQALEPGEQIRTRVVPWAEAVAMCGDGRIEDAKTIAGILLVDAMRRRAGGHALA